ncbi:hypothetical protein D3C76_1874130 [compost metagenome]
MAVDNEGMQIKSNIYKAYSAGKNDQREVMPVGQINHFLGNAAEIGPQFNA